MLRKNLLIEIQSSKKQRIFLQLQSRMLKCQAKSLKQDSRFLNSILYMHTFFFKFYILKLISVSFLILIDFLSFLKEMEELVLEIESLKEENKVLIDQVIFLYLHIFALFADLLEIHLKVMT